MKLKRSGLMFIALFYLAVMANGALQYSRNVPTQGNVKKIGIEAYWDSACTNVTTNMYWNVWVGDDPLNQTIYVKNIGSGSETLTLTTMNWMPNNASLYVSLTWNRQNYVLASKAVIDAKLTMTVLLPEEIQFNFTTVITGTKV